MTKFFLRFLSTTAMAAGLAGCVTAPGDAYYEPAYHPAYGEPSSVYIYQQPYITRPYLAPPPPLYYGGPGYDRHWDDRRPAPPGYWRGPDRDDARDPHRAPERPNPTPRPPRPDRREPDREPHGGEPSRKPTPQGPDRPWRDARPPAQGQSADDGRGPGGRLSMPGGRP